MEYMIARGARKAPNEALKALEEHVNQVLSEGWQPIGAVSFTFFGNYDKADSHGFVALQAMTRGETAT